MSFWVCVSDPAAEQVVYAISHMGSKSLARVPFIQGDPGPVALNEITTPWRKADDRYQLFSDIFRTPH